MGSTVLLNNSDRVRELILNRRTKMEVPLQLSPRKQFLIGVGKLSIPEHAHPTVPRILNFLRKEKT